MFFKTSEDPGITLFPEECPRHAPGPSPWPNTWLDYIKKQIAKVPLMGSGAKEYYSEKLYNTKLKHRANDLAGTDKRG